MVASLAHLPLPILPLPSALHQGQAGDEAEEGEGGEGEQGARTTGQAAASGGALPASEEDAGC